MRFIKMHGLGNDYVYINCFAQTVHDPAALAVKIADRHTGVGGDGLILVLPPDPPDDRGRAEGSGGAIVRMRMFNADGSEAEMCGNGVRCVCKLAYDHNVTPGIRPPGIPGANPMRVQTGRGVLSLAYTLDAAGKVDQVTVDMGEPILTPADIPIDETKLVATGRPHEYRLAVAQVNELLTLTTVSMGNPHAVIFCDDVRNVELERIGPAIETAKAFPRRINVHFVQVHSPDEVTMRTWERGSGVTLACGTGAAAVCVAGVIRGRTGRNVLAHLPGGDLLLEWRESDSRVYMTGPATEVFVGEGEF